MGALVLSAFSGPRPPGLLCLHANDNPRDNRPENLRWGTATENNHDAIRNGRVTTIGSTHPHAKLTEDGVRSIMVRVARGDRPLDIAKGLQVDVRRVSAVIHGWTWSWLTGVVRP